MVKSGAHILESAMNLPANRRVKNREVNFSIREETSETSMVEKITEKLDVRVRVARLKKRMRTRSTNIL
ncbi:MAG: hypothetical protein ACR2GD_11300 [Pyrinomonadaceae bacterium]